MEKNLIILDRSLKDKLFIREIAATPLPYVEHYIYGLVSLSSPHNVLRTTKDKQS